jgi:hypothetical protein
MVQLEGLDKLKKIIDFIGTQSVTSWFAVYCLNQVRSHAAQYIYQVDRSQILD